MRLVNCSLWFERSEIKKPQNSDMLGTCTTAKNADREREKERDGDGDGGAEEPVAGHGRGHHGRFVARPCYVARWLN